jgi:hypothetical protein
MRYGDSLSSLSLVTSCTGGISLFYLRLGGLTFLGFKYRYTRAHAPIVKHVLV